MGPIVCLSGFLRPALSKAGLAICGLLLMSAAPAAMARAHHSPDPIDQAPPDHSPAPRHLAPPDHSPAPNDQAPPDHSPAPRHLAPPDHNPDSVDQAGWGYSPAPRDQDRPQAASTSDGENEKTRVFEYGMNMGLYLANGHTANFYNGSGGGTAGRRSLEQILDNSQTYNRIRQDLGFDFSLDGLPGNMGYSPSILFGFFASLQLGERSALIAEFNYTRLKAEDQFTLRLERFSNIEGDNIERFAISGSEERIDLRLGAQYTFLRSESYIHPYLEAGISVTDTKVRNNSARIGNSSYSLFFAPTSRNVYEREYGMSPGAYAGLGLKMDVTENFRLTLGYSSQYVRIKLGENDRFLLQHTLFVRLNLNHVIGAAGPVAE